MRKFLIAILCLLTVGASGKTINIATRGAKADGATDNTAIIQKAIDECSASGVGTVVIPEGKFLTGTLIMKSNVRLQLEFGAVLLGITALESYSKALEAVAAGPGAKTSLALIYAKDVSNIAVTGPGTIDGQGGHKNFQHGNDSDGGPRRPKIIYFVDCKNVTIQDITLRNSAYWTQDYEGCDGVMIRGVKVYSHCNYNNDGLDIDSRNVVVSDCYIDCDDDALCFKSDTPESCENVSVTNCVLASNCNAVKFGTASLGGFRNITVSNCAIRKASEENIRHWQTSPLSSWVKPTGPVTVLAGIAIESVDGGTTDGIQISGITMTDVQTPIFIRLGDRRQTYSKHVSVLRNVNISNVVARSASLVACSITGVPGHYVENVTLSNIRITIPGGGTAEHASQAVPEKEKSYPENRMFDVVLPASGFYVRHAKNITFDNVFFEPLSPDAREPYKFEDAHNVVVNNQKIK